MVSNKRYQRHCFGSDDKNRFHVNVHETAKGEIPNLAPGYKEEGDCGQCTNCIVQTQDNQYCFDDYMKIFEVGIQDDDANDCYS